MLFWAMEMYIANTKKVHWVTNYKTIYYTLRSKVRMIKRRALNRAII